MGAYLGSPSTEKKSDDYNDSEKFSFGASRMQGWRISMEDAHNCVPDLTENSSLFGVYDGHGGSEVALYCALHITDVLKDLKSFKDGEFETALKEAFMALDKELLNPEAIRELKVLADRDLDMARPSEEEIAAAEMERQDEEECEEDEVAMLTEEATMSLEELKARYAKVANETRNKLEERKHGEKAQSSKLTNSSNSDKSQCSSSSAAASSSKIDKSEEPKQVISEVSSSVKSNAEEMPSTSGPSSSKDYTASSGSGSSDATVSSSSSISRNSDVKPEQSNEVSSSDSKNPEFSGKEQHKDTDTSEKKSEKLVNATKTTSAKMKSGKIQPKGKAVKLGLEDDENFEPELSESDSGEDDGFESDEAVEGSSDTEQESDEEDDSDDEEDDEIAAVPALSAIASNNEEPGKDSGTTAVVALLNDYQLFVANAGDSRCVLCREDVALDMSHDHKPEDEEELARIKNAGGYVSGGRVNGGLNLSRAIGDHSYKMNEKFDLKNQMISAVPDVKKVTLKKGDKFMVLACDGIWNTLSSQDVVNFVLARLPDSDSKDEIKLSSICEELMTTCLAPDTTGDGTGCDNMTCIIIKFNDEWLDKSTPDETDKNEVTCGKNLLKTDLASGERVEIAVKTNGLESKKELVINSGLPIKRTRDETNIENSAKKQKSV